MNSTSVACKRIVSKSLIMGLFHNSKAVRVHCSLLVHRQLRLATELADQSPTGRDLFHTGDNMQLTGWKFSSAPPPLSSSSLNKKKGIIGINIPLRENSLEQAESSTKRTGCCFTHLDVRRVASLGLGCCDEDGSDPSLRASACNQLLDMLGGDDQLVRTADLSWAVLSTKQALRTAEKLLFASRLRGDRVSTIAVGDDSLSAGQRGLLVAAVKLSIFLSARIAAIRQMVSLFDSDHAGSDDDTEARESISLQILVELCLLSTSTAAAAASSSVSETFQVVKGLSAQFLCSLCCSSETWCASTGQLRETIHNE